MDTLKIDRSRLKTVRSFAYDKNLTVQQIYNWIKDGKVECTEIDGVKFIVV
jgi:hypothetical protein